MYAYQSRRNADVGVLLDSSFRPQPATTGGLQQVVVDFQVCDAALEVSGLLQGEYEGGNVVHHALAFVVPALFGLEPVDDAAVDDQGSGAVVTLDRDFEPVTVLDAVAECVEVAVAGEAHHAADRVAEIEYGVL